MLCGPTSCVASGVITFMGCQVYEVAEEEAVNVHGFPAHIIVELAASETGKGETETVTALVELPQAFWPVTV